MIRSLLWLNVHPGCEREFEESFRRLHVFERAGQVAGMRSAELLRPIQGSTYVVVATWERAEDYDRWLDSSIRAELNESLSALLASAGQPAMFEIVDRHPEH